MSESTVTTTVLQATVSARAALLRSSFYVKLRRCLISDEIWAPCSRRSPLLNFAVLAAICNLWTVKCGQWVILR